MSWAVSFAKHSPFLSKSLAIDNADNAARPLVGRVDGERYDADNLYR